MRPRIIILHGLNNNLESFYPLKERFESYGFDAHLVALPGHAEDRHEIKTFQEAFNSFDQNMKKLVQDPYVILAFSTGAMYFQLWLEKNLSPKPKAQVLLAPALFLRRLPLFEKIARTLPASLFILSQTPKSLRRYKLFYIWEYRILFEGIKKYLGLKTKLKIPTLLIMDPKDELIDPTASKKEFEARDPGGFFEMKLIERDYLKKKRPGKYHIIFHPDYLSPDHWAQINHDIHEFFRRFI